LPKERSSTVHSHKPTPPPPPSIWVQCPWPLQLAASHLHPADGAKGGPQKHWHPSGAYCPARTAIRWLLQSSAALHSRGTSHAGPAWPLSQRAVLQSGPDQPRSQSEQVARAQDLLPGLVERLRTVCERDVSAERILRLRRGHHPRLLRDARRLRNALVLRSLAALGSAVGAAGARGVCEVPVARTARGRRGEWVHLQVRSVRERGSVVRLSVESGNRGFRSLGGIALRGRHYVI
jgi:hypothetical protein